MPSHPIPSHPRLVGNSHEGIVDRSWLGWGGEGVLLCPCGGGTVDDGGTFTSSSTFISREVYFVLLLLYDDTILYHTILLILILLLPYSVPPFSLLATLLTFYTM